MEKIRNDFEFLEIPYDESKYKYWLSTWGGFYNKNNKDIHHFEEGKYSFNTKEEREAYIAKLKAFDKSKLDRFAILMIETGEGYTLENLPALHIILKHKRTQKIRHIVHSLYINHDCLTLLYYIEYKCPLENILGDEIEEYNIIKSYITGIIDTTDYTKELIEHRV